MDFWNSVKQKKTSQFSIKKFVHKKSLFLPFSESAQGVSKSPFAGLSAHVFSAKCATQCIFVWVLVVEAPNFYGVFNTDLMHPIKAVIVMWGLASGGTCRRT